MGYDKPDRAVPPTLAPAGRYAAMKLGLINSAWVQAGKETPYGIWMTREIGFDSIDIFADPLDSSEMELRLIKYECDRAGLPIVSVACVALGLADFNPSVQRFHAQRVRAYIDMARQFGARNVLLVLGEYVWQKEVIPPAEQWDAAVGNVRAIGSYAAELGVQVALEMEPFALSLLNDVPGMARFLSEVDVPAVKANVDISHMALAGQGPESLEALRGRIAHVHISDCDGKVHGDLPPGRGVVEFGGYLRMLKELGVDSDTVSIELEYSPEPSRIADWVREAYDATDRLMRDAGLRG
jgi:sugar phosphate isomerase/epimerase